VLGDENAGASARAGDTRTPNEEFIEHDAALPTCIPWLDEHELPGDSFPPQWEQVPTVDR
jgi:hypothetical protein